MKLYGKITMSILKLAAICYSCLRKTNELQRQKSNATIDSYLERDIDIPILYVIRL